MASYIYKTVAAPRRLRKARGVKGPEALLAHSMDEVMAAEAAAGWEYLRADSLPIEEGGGFFSRPKTVWRAVLVFRRAAGDQRAGAAPAAAEVEPRGSAATQEPFIRVAATAPAPADHQAPPIGGAKRE